MKKFLISWVMVAVVAANVFAETFYLDDDHVSFDAPASFTKLSDQEIATKFPSNRAPKFVVGNEKRSVTIAYDVKPDHLEVGDLPAFQESMTQMFSRVVPNIRWIKSEVVTIHGRDFAHLEFISSAIDADIHNVMLTTSYQKQMLMFNFNATVADFDAYETQLRQAIDSIVVKD